MAAPTPNLGRYVIFRWRADGTALTYFGVPARLRPPGWPSLIPLPTTGARRGDLSDSDEAGRIRADAAELYPQLLAARTRCSRLPSAP